MSFKKTVIKYVAIIFILVVLSNPFHSATEYNQKTAWLTGFMFGLILVFAIFIQFKNKLGGGDNGKGKGIHNF